MNRQSMRSLVSQAESASPIQLRRLSLVGTNGLCNRLRAIASARRLCAILSARCSIVWDWGEYTSLFEPCCRLQATNGREVPMRCLLILAAGLFVWVVCGCATEDGVVSATGCPWCGGVGKVIDSSLLFRSECPALRIVTVGFKNIPERIRYGG